MSAPEVMDAMENLDETLNRVLARHDELGAALAQGLDGDRFVKLSKEFAEVAPVAEAIRAIRTSSPARTRRTSAR